MNRRESLKLMAVASLGAGLAGCTEADLRRARDEVDRQMADGGLANYTAQFFTPHEYETVKVLADLIIPADGRSGSATDAGVHAFIDFTAWDRPVLQTPLRGGLRWLDYQCHKRFGRAFLDCTDAERTELLDLIAYPEDAPPEMSQGVRFFNLFRDLTASGFWTSKMGMEDLQYMGNVPRGEWPGCPQDALDHLGVQYT